MSIKILHECPWYKLIQFGYSKYFLYFQFGTILNLSKYVNYIFYIFIPGTTAAMPTSGPTATPEGMYYRNKVVTCL